MGAHVMTAAEFAGYDAGTVPDLAADIRAQIESELIAKEAAEFVLPPILMPESPRLSRLHRPQRGIFRGTPCAHTSAARATGRRPPRKNSAPSTSETGNVSHAGADQSPNRIMTNGTSKPNRKPPKSMMPATGASTALISMPAASTESVGSTTMPVKPTTL